MALISETTFWKESVADRLIVFLVCSSLPPKPLPPLLPLTNKILGDNLFSAEHIHGQNCLEDYGVKVAVQKLKNIDNSRLQDM